MQISKHHKFVERLSKLKTKPYLIVIILMGVILFVSAWYLHHKIYYPSTNDATIEANEVHIAAQVSGPVTRVYVENHQYVKAKTPLFDIDKRPYEFAVKEAEATLKMAWQDMLAKKDAITTAQSEVQKQEAQLFKAKQHATRILPLVRAGKMAKSDGDTATSDLRSAQASLNIAKSRLKQAIEELGTPGENNPAIQQATEKLKQAELDLSHTRIRAPNNGYLTNFNLRKGSNIQKGQALFVLIENERWWIQANFKETDLDRIQPGQTASIRLDMYPKLVLKGIVKSINPATGSALSLLPPENASGNWIKITQRIPVKILITHPYQNYPLRVGASSSVVVDTTKQFHPSS